MAIDDQTKADPSPRDGLLKTLGDLRKAIEGLPDDLLLVGGYSSDDGIMIQVLTEDQEPPDYYRPAGPYLFIMG